MLRRYPTRSRRRVVFLGETPPPPKEPVIPTAADAEAYLAWMKPRVEELDASVQVFATALPEKAAAGLVTADQAVSFAGAVIPWNGWVLEWKKYAQNLSEQTWAGFVKKHVELEEWRHRFKKLGVDTPEATNVPQGGDKDDPFKKAADKFTTGLVITGVVVAGVVAWKVLS